MQERTQEIECKDAATTAPQEMTEQELNDVAGGIIIIGGVTRFSAPSFTFQSLSFGYDG